MSGEIVFVIHGEPAPKGSLRCVGQNGKHQLIEDNRRTKPWREQIAQHVAVGSFRALKDEPIGVEITSTLPRYASHVDADGNPTAKAPPFPVGGRTGDVDKLARLVLDALEDASVVANDSQVVEVLSRKTWPDTDVPDSLDEPGVMIRIYTVL